MNDSPIGWCLLLGGAALTAITIWTDWALNRRSPDPRSPWWKPPSSVRPG